MKYIRLQNTGNLLSCDESDWKQARDVKWYENDGHAMTLDGVRFDHYCKIPGTRKRYAELLNYRRTQYENQR